MSNLTAGRKRTGLRLLCLLVFFVMLVGAEHASRAAAANVTNPDPGLIERWEPCEPEQGVTVIVDDQQIGTGMIYVGCAPGEQATGVQALQHAGFELEGTTNYGLAFICRIDQEPTPAEQSCATTPGAGAYWSYWRARPGGRWQYSGGGADSPQSRSPVNSVEGWSFGGGKPPRIEPMDGTGPSSFHLPAPQESSLVPALLARAWLAPVLDQTVALAEELEAKHVSEHPEAGELLPGAIALARAHAEPAVMEPIVAWLARSCEERHATVEGCPLRELANPKARPAEQNAEHFALAVLGLQALGQNPSSFAGMDLRAELEGMIEPTTGEVESEGRRQEGVEVTAPTVLALARTGELPAKALKTVDLILAAQDADTGSLEATTEANAQAIEALAAAREQGASVLGQSRLEKIEAALAKAGGYLESIEEPPPEGGVRVREDTGPEYAANVESSALGAVGLALSGRRAAAERAAKWVSRYQVTGENAGIGNPEIGEHTPAEAVIGAFLNNESSLRDVLADGVQSENFKGLYHELQLPTIDALLALVTAGPYGPYDAAFDQQSLLFETRTVGSQSRPLTATLSNHDVRPITIAGVSVTGDEPGDFSADGGECAGTTLAPGESCDLSVSFDPTATGPREALLQLELAGTEQTIELPLTGTGTPEAVRAKGKPEESGSPTPETTSTSSQEVLGSQIASPAPRLDGLGAGRGLVGVSWQALQGGDGLGSWTISSRTLGVTGASYVTRATGIASATSALVKLPPGAAYELQITFVDLLGGSSTIEIGKVLVPYDDRSSALRYRGSWHRIKQPGAWLDTVSRGGAGSQVSLALAAGEPVFTLRGTSAGARVEVRAGSQRQLFAIAKAPADVPRRITAMERSRAGTVTLLVLKGTVDLDGVAVER